MTGKIPADRLGAGSLRKSGKSNKSSADKNTKQAEKQKDIKQNINLKHDPAYFLGRSMISGKKVNQAEINLDTLQNIANDLKVLKENPTLVEKSDKFFEIAFKGLSSKNDSQAYEKAVDMQVGLVDEFKK